MNYKDTIHLFETPFQMRADLVNREPVFLKHLEEENYYLKLRVLCKGRKKFILHDGPPYANGELHVGHALNKILKDIIIRYKTIDGFDAAFVPGWDCHGLPIELNIEKQYSKNLADKEIRNKCREYANSQIESQKRDFKTLLIIADWENPYTTMNFTIEANTIKALKEIYLKGLIQKGEKPVFWCFDCKSALAEAEVEYQNKISDSVYVKFAVLNHNGYFKMLDKDSRVNVLVWTTTPWTLPANKAVAINEEFSYSLVKYNEEYFIIASDLVDAVFSQIKVDDSHYEIINKITAKELQNVKLQHPFYDYEIPIVLASYVTLDAGTGLVHTAPAHGPDDFTTGKKYNLEIYNPVAIDGRYLENTPLLANVNIWKANQLIINILKEKNNLLFTTKIEHSYPHCWRHKSPLIFRTTAQWFISIDNKKFSLKKQAIHAMNEVAFLPSHGRTRLQSMIQNRPDWCISRQRNWGVPLPFFIHKDTNVPHKDSAIIFDKVIDLVNQNGINAWFNEDLTLKSLGLDDNDNYIKIHDIIDVWFDSGVTHYTILKHNSKLGFPADIYFEGSDQHRGWFQSSLLTSVIINNKAPYKQIITHGFLIDENGYKMSKSKGNIVSLKTAVRKYGADIVRLWVASTNYQEDIVFSDEAMKRVSDSYRRIRNTIRFLLANIIDFNYDVHKVEFNDLLDVDKYAICKLKNLQMDCKNYYDNYQFYTLTKELVAYTIDELGSFYLDVLKDRLYTTKVDGKPRRSAQTVLFHILKELLLLLSPILAFTSDEAWKIFTNDNSKSTLYESFTELDKIIDNKLILNKWDQIRDFRILVLKELENKRINNEIGSSLQSKLIIHVTKELYDILSSLNEELKFVYMVSSVELKLSDTIFVEVLRYNEPKCERCWHYDSTVTTSNKYPTICNRCIENVHGIGETRKYI